jgi:hypothetical protein
LTRFNGANFPVCWLGGQIEGLTVLGFKVTSEGRILVLLYIINVLKTFLVAPESAHRCFYSFEVTGYFKVIQVFLSPYISLKNLLACTSMREKCPTMPCGQNRALQKPL